MSTLDRLLGTWEIAMHRSAMSELVTGRQRYERVLDVRSPRLPGRHGATVG